MKKHGSPVRIFTNIHPQKIKLSADEGYRYKILLTFFIEDFFFNRNQEKFVKYIQVKTKLLLTFSLVILPFYGIMGGKYMHLDVYPVCEFSCACTCMSMNIDGAIILTPSSSVVQCTHYLLAEIFSDFIGFVQYARDTLPRRTFTVMCVTVAQQK